MQNSQASPSCQGLGPWHIVHTPGLHTPEGRERCPHITNNSNFAKPNTGMVRHGSSGSVQLWDIELASSISSGWGVASGASSHNECTRTEGNPTWPASQTLQTYFCMNTYIITCLRASQTQQIGAKLSDYPLYWVFRANSNLQSPFLNNLFLFSSGDISSIITQSGCCKKSIQFSDCVPHRE